MNVFKLTCRLLLFRPALFILNCLAWGLHHSLPLATGLIAQAFIDRLSGGSADPAWYLLALLVGIACWRMVNALLGVNIWATMYFSTGALVRKNLLTTVFRRPAAAAIPSSPGEAISRFRDDVEEVCGYVENWVDLSGMLLYSLIAVVIMFRTDATLTLVVAAPLVGVALVPTLAGKRIRKYRQAQRKATGKVTSFIGEIFGAVQAVKVAEAEQRTVARFNILNETRRRAALKDVLFDQLLMAADASIINLGTGAMLFLVAGAMQRGTFTAGDFALFVTYYGRLTDCVGFIGSVLAQHKRAGVSFGRMSAFLQGEPPENLVAHSPIAAAQVAEVTPLVPAPPLQMLEVSGLCYRYGESGGGISDISFRVTAGSFVVVTGEIGSGKSTLMQSILGLLPATAGEIRWNGTLVTDPAAFFTPPRAAYTPQAPRLFSESLRDNIRLGRPFSEERLQEAIYAAVLEDDLRETEAGLDTMVGPRGVRLSGGQIQRAAAARMFAHQSELLVCDDLSSALDVETERVLWERLFTGRKCTCLVVSHRREALRRADQILLLCDCRVAAAGTLPELLQSSAQMRQL